MTMTTRTMWMREKEKNCGNYNCFGKNSRGNNNSSNNSNNNSLNYYNSKKQVTAKEGKTFNCNSNGEQMASRHVQLPVWAVSTYTTKKDPVSLCLLWYLLMSTRRFFCFFVFAPSHPWTLALYYSNRNSRIHHRVH